MFKLLKRIKGISIFYKLLISIIFILFYLSNLEAFCGERYGLIWENEFTDNINSVSISSDGKYIGVGCNDNKICFFDKSGKNLWTYKAKFPIEDVSITSNGEYIFAGGNRKNFPISDGEIYYLKRNGEFLWSSKTRGVSSISISEDGNYRAFTSQNWLGWFDEVLFFDYDKWTWHDSIGWKNTSSVSVSGNGNYIAVGSGDDGLNGGGIRLYNKEGKLLWKYKIPDSSYNGSKHSVSISKDGKYIAAGNENGNKIYLLNQQGKLLWSYEVVKSIKDVSISADGSYITFVSMDNSLYVLDSKGKVLWNRKINYISSVSISADGNSLAVGTFEKKVYFVENSRTASQRIYYFSRKIKEGHYYQSRILIYSI